MSRLILVFSLLAPFWSSCQPIATVTVKDQVFPGSTWLRTDNLKRAGWKADEIITLKNYIADSSDATGVMVIQSGKVLMEHGNTTELSYLASCRKSILSMLYGPFVKNNRIDLSQTIEELQLDDVGGLLPIEKKATIQQLITARSGVYHRASNDGDATSMAPKRGSVQPGSYWLYNNWDFNIAGYILEQKTGRTIYQLLDSMLAKPLQMQDWDLSAQQKGGDTLRSRYLAYHIWLSTRDMARIGYLMLRNGRWNNQQIIPADWIRTTTTVLSSNRDAVKNRTAYFDFGYGYMWWIWEAPLENPAYEGAYTASGAFGQYITVIPKFDLVIALKTNPENGRQTSMQSYLKILSKLLAAHE